MSTCKTCRYWQYDTTDRQDSNHAIQGRRPCSLAVGVLAKGTYFHESTKACNKFAKVTDRVVKSA